MDKNMNEFYMQILKNVAEKLEKNGFKAKDFPDKEEATKFILKTVGRNKKVGFGGCMTASEMNLPKLLSKNKNEIITHLPQMNKKERFETWFRAQRADFYFASRDLDEGYWRMRNISAIPNNIRLNKNNPCVETGRCVDCNSPERICNVLTVLLKKPKFTDYMVVLINEELEY